MNMDLDQIKKDRIRAQVQSGEVFRESYPYCPWCGRAQLDDISALGALNMWKSTTCDHCEKIFWVIEESVFSTQRYN